MTKPTQPKRRGRPPGPESGRGRPLSTIQLDAALCRELRAASRAAGVPISDYLYALIGSRGLSPDIADRALDARVRLERGIARISHAKQLMGEAVRLVHEVITVHERVTCHALGSLRPSPTPEVLS